MKKKIETKELKIKDINPDIVKKIAKDSFLFTRFIKANPGFVDEVVLSVIGRNRSHEDYEDLHQAGMFGVFKSMKSYNTDKSKFSTYAFTVAKNEVRQQIKKLNKQRNIIKKKDGTGGYDHHEISMQYLMTNLGTGGDEVSEFNEMLFKDTPEIVRLRNFEDVLVNEMTLEKTMEKFDVISKEIIHYHFYEGKSLREIAELLQYNYHTLRILFYHHIRPKFSEAFQGTI